METWITLLLLVGAGGVVALILHLRRGRWQAALLRRKHKNKLNMPEELAESVIEDNLARLREQYPGRPEEWYLDKMLYELDRDRR